MPRWPTTSRAARPWASSAARWTPWRPAPCACRCLAALPKQDERPDFELVADERGKLVRIERQPRSDANRIVEECMIAANLDAGRLLAASGGGVFVVHTGFRPERVEQARKVLQEQVPELAEGDFTSLAGYLSVARALDARRPERPVRAILSRLLERARLSAEPAPHYGLGAEVYTTATSPIRRYSDFLVHRLIKAGLAGAPRPAIELEALQAGVDRVRQAVGYCETWLECRFAESLVGQSFEGVIVAVNGGGFTVRLDANGLRGFVDLRKFPVKLAFDSTYFAHAGEGVRFELDQPVRVLLAGVDHKRRSIRLELDPALLPAG